MADYTTIQHGDPDDAGAIDMVAGHDNLADHVAYGLAVNGDFSTSPGTLSISEGKAFVLVDTLTSPQTGVTYHQCLLTAHLDARSGVALASTGMNYVWVQVDPTPNGTPSIAVTDTDVAPSDDSVKIAEVDAGTQTVTEVNRNPDGEFADLIGGSVTVNDSITWPDGETTNTHPLTYGEPIDNRNNYYDSRVADPPGVVQRAANADSADTATTADNATTADTAADANHLDGYTRQEILGQAEDYTASEWEPLLNQPATWTDTNSTLNFSHRVDNPYDRYRVGLQMDNYNPWIDSIYVQVNNITAEKYRLFNLEYSEYEDTVDDRHSEIDYETHNYWKVGETMPRSHSVQEFYLACPQPVKGAGNGPINRYPLFSSGEVHTGTVRSYHLTGNLTQSVKAIDHIRIFSDHGNLAAKIQIYGRNGV